MILKKLYNSAITGVLFLLLLTPIETDALNVGFNCGDTLRYRGGNGILYFADREYEPGSGGGAVGGAPWRDESHVNIGGDEDPELYRTCRVGVEKYCFEIPQGMYIVKMGFVESEHDWKGQRVQDVWIEGNHWLEDLDIWTEVESNYAIEYRFLTTLTDDCLDVVFSADSGETCISSISVHSVTPNSTPPSKPTNVDIEGGYGENILSWDVHSAEDIEGFNIYRKAFDSNYILQNEIPVRTPRFIDNEVDEGVTYKYRISAVDLFGNESSFTSPLTAVPVGKHASQVPSYDFYITEEDLAYLNTHVFSDEYVPVVFEGEGSGLIAAELRYRGRTSREWHKKGHKFKFGGYVPELSAERINLKASTETSMIREHCAFRFFRDIGLPASEAAFRLLWRNGMFQGVFTRIEQVDAFFLENHGLDGNANIYKCYGTFPASPYATTYRRCFEKETNEQGSYRDIIELTEMINWTNGDRFRDLLSNYFDVEECLTWYAAQMALGNPDFIDQNHYLYHSVDDGLWKFLPWDLDLCFGVIQADLPIDYGTHEHPHGVAEVVNPFWDKILNEPQLRRRYGLILKSLIDDHFVFQNTGATIVAAADSIRLDGRRDYRKTTFEKNLQFEMAPQRMLVFLKDRKSYIKGRLPGFVPPPSVELYLNEICLQNESVIEDEAGDFDPWVEIYNDSDSNISLAGMLLSDGETEWYFASGATMNPREHLIVWLDGETWEGQYHSSLVPSPDGGVLMLLDPGNEFENPCDSLHYKHGLVDESFGRYRDAGYFFDYLELPSPGEPNEWISPVVIDVASESDTVQPGDDATFEITVANRADSLVSIDLSYFFRFGIGLRRPHKGNEELGALSVPPLSETTVELTVPVHEKLLRGSVDFIVWAEKEDGAVIQTGETSILVQETAPVRLVLNEFMAINDGCIMDEFDEYDDWIELFNGEDRDLRSTRCYITDDLSEPGKFLLPDVVIPAGGHLLIWADGDTEQGPLHCPFKLSGDGEELGLFLKIGGEFVYLDGRTFGAQDPDISEGRSIDGAPDWVRFDPASPGLPNGS